MAQLSLFMTFKMLTPRDIGNITRASESKRLRRAVALTPEERMDRFNALQEAAGRVLSLNPAALAAFHQRNRRCRRESQVQLLLARIRSE